MLVPVRNPIWLQFLFHKLLRLLTPYIAILAALGALGVAWQRLGPMPILAAAALGALGAVLPRVGPRVRRLVFPVRQSPTTAVHEGACPVGRCEGDSIHGICVEPRPAPGETSKDKKASSRPGRKAHATPCESARP